MKKSYPFPVYTRREQILVDAILESLGNIGLASDIQQNEDTRRMAALETEVLLRRALSGFSNVERDRSPSDL